MRSIDHWSHSPVDTPVTVTFLGWGWGLGGEENGKRKEERGDRGQTAPSLSHTTHHQLLPNLQIFSRLQTFTYARLSRIPHFTLQPQLKHHLIYEGLSLMDIHSSLSQPETHSIHTSLPSPLSNCSKPVSPSLTRMGICVHTYTVQSLRAELSALLCLPDIWNRIYVC